MPQVAWPAEARIVGMSQELFSPGRIVHRLRDGSWDTPLLRARPRWNGTVTLGKYAIRKAEVARVEMLVADLSDPSDWAEMPWGGAPPLHPVPGDTWTASVTAVVGRLVTLARTVGTDEIALGDWVRYGNRVAIVRSLAGTQLDPQITTRPFIPAVVGGVFRPAHTIRVRMRNPGERGITIGRDTGYGGATTIEWEEV